MQTQKNNPLVSIITVCFNSEKTIKRTIESVLNQTYRNIEYIVIDGLSTDSTIDILNGYKSEFANRNIDFKVVSEKDNGIYDAMNKAIKIAKGEWTGIINSDDWYEKNACELVVNNIDSEIGLIYGICALYDLIQDETYSFVGVMQHSPEAMYYLNKDMAHPAVFVNHSIYKQYQFSLEFKLASDVDFLMWVYSHGYKSKFVPNIISNFRCDGATGQQKFLSSIENITVRYKYGRISKLFYLKRKIVNLIKLFFKY